MVLMSRTEGLDLLHKYTKSESLRKHALCVEAAMAHFANIYGEDEQYWAMVGLLHDLDYELYPTEHCQHTPQMLREAGFDEDFIYHVNSHGYGLCTDAVPRHIMEKVVYTVDELTGFVTACALVRPSKSVMDLEVKSVRKKFKTANFAAAINRQVIENGAEMMGKELDYLIGEVIVALQKIADDIGFGVQQ